MTGLCSVPHFPLAQSLILNLRCGARLQAGGVTSFCSARVYVDLPRGAPAVQPACPWQPSLVEIPRLASLLCPPAHQPCSHWVCPLQTLETTQLCHSLFCEHRDADESKVPSFLLGVAAPSGRRSPGRLSSCPCSGCRCPLRGGLEPREAACGSLSLLGPPLPAEFPVSPVGSIFIPTYEFNQCVFS